ncbi:MAG: intermembrane transport protein PqiB [Aeromonadaceae bacterium]
MTFKQIPITARVNQLRHLSPIWLVPIVAALIGLWLVYATLSNQGPLITMTMVNAEGIEAGKTMIKARSVEVGTVQSVRLSEDLSHVVVTARMAVDTEDLLRQDSQMWVVKPRIERQGISGLGTLLSGAYIELLPGKGKKYADHFAVLDTPPVAQPDEKGLRIQLISDQSRGLNIGDPVMYRGFTVGRVEQSHFSAGSRQMEYQLFISAPYDSLVTSNARFWLNGGLRFEASTEGVKFETGSLENIIKGGISFDVPKGWNLGKPVESRHQFKLYTDETSSRMRDYDRYLEYVLLFDDSVRGLAEGAPVEYRGIRIGTVQEVPYQLDDGKLLGTTQGQIPVLIRIEPERFDADNSERALGQLYRDLEQQIRKGLRATLKTGSLLTGALFVDFNFQPDSPRAAGYGRFGKYPTIPTLPGGLARIEQQANRLLTKLNALPLDTTLGNLDAMLKESKQSFAAMRELSANLNQLTKQPGAQQLPAELTKTMQELQKTLQSFSSGSPVYGDLNRSIESLNQLLRELRPVARKVNDKPNSLIFNQTLPPDPQPRSAR